MSLAERTSRSVSHTPSLAMLLGRQFVEEGFLTSSSAIAPPALPEDIDPRRDPMSSGVGRADTGFIVGPGGFGRAVVLSSSTAGTMNDPAGTLLVKDVVFVPNFVAFQESESKIQETSRMVSVDSAVRGASAIVAAISTMSLIATLLTGAIIVQPVFAAMLLLSSIGFFIMTMVKDG